MFKSMEKDDNNNHVFKLFGPTPPSATPSDKGMADGDYLYRSQPMAENRLYEQLLNKYHIAMTRLKEVTKEANALHEENDWLQLANEDLTRRLLLWSNGSGSGPGSIVDDENENYSSYNSNSRSRSSPTSVMVDNDSDSSESFSLPKSISVPSPSYFKLLNNKPAAPNSSLIRSHHVNATKLRVRGEEKAIDIEVHKQGMYKTELCNKWEESGSCSYGDHCRFAHGLTELRPVIRHPRYKTQICRMLLTGSTCPYGHRCHFRHSIPPPTTTSAARLSPLS